MYSFVPIRTPSPPSPLPRTAVALLDLRRYLLIVIVASPLVVVMDPSQTSVIHLTLSYLCTPTAGRIQTTVVFFFNYIGIRLRSKLAIYDRVSLSVKPILLMK